MYIRSASPVPQRTMRILSRELLYSQPALAPPFIKILTFFEVKSLTGILAFRGLEEGPY